MGGVISPHIFIYGWWLFSMNNNYFLKRFGYILATLVLGMCIGSYMLYYYLFFSFTSTVIENDIEDIVTERKDIVEERVVKYFEITEEDLYNVFYRYINETIVKYTKISNDEYVQNVASAFVDQLQYVPQPEIVFYTIAMGKKESKFDISAKPPKRFNSSASGIGQVIWRWHSDKLLKTYPWRDGNITREMLDTDISASIDAMYLVFENYLINSKNYKEATISYFGKNHSELAKNKYRLSILKEYHLLTQRLFRAVLSKPVKTKIVHVNCDGEVVCEYPIDPNIKF